MTLKTSIIYYYKVLEPVEKVKIKHLTKLKVKTTSIEKML